jgi:hypothetical protein
MSHIIGLIYELQCLDDLARSNLGSHTLSLIVPEELIKENPKKFLNFPNVIPVKGYLESASVESLIFKHHKRQPIDRIVAVHEVDILRAAKLRQLLNLPGQNFESAQHFRRKTMMKQCLKNHGFLVPSFAPIQSAADILDFMNHHSFPLILKPDLGTGSRGVTILHSQNQVLSFLKKKRVFPANQPLDWQIEEFIPGQMYHINGLVLHGQVVASWPALYPHQSIKMTQGHFASSILLSQENPLTNKLNSYAKHILEILPTPLHTAFHLEVFVTPSDEIIFCEIASRIGGKGVRLSWLESFGIDLGKIFVEAQVAWENYSDAKKHFLKPSVLSGEIWFPTRQGTLQAIEKICPYTWVKDYQVFFKPGERITKSQDINSCVAGTALFIGSNESEMHQRLGEFVHWFETHTHWH